MRNETDMKKVLPMENPHTCPQFYLSAYRDKDEDEDDFRSREAFPNSILPRCHPYSSIYQMVS